MRVVQRMPMRRGPDARWYAPYGATALPAGRVVMTPYPARVWTFADERAHRIAAAQAAGYIVVRSRSVEFPDGRRLRTYRPYEEDDGLE